MIKQSIITITTLGLLSVSALAFDTTACAGCHGKDFEKKALNVSKIVKDMSKEDIEKALKGYKDGSYGGAMKTVMKGQAAKLSDEDITAIATQIAGGGDAKAEDANKTVEDANKTAEDTNKTAEKASK